MDREDLTLRVRRLMIMPSSFARFALGVLRTPISPPGLFRTSSLRSLMLHRPIRGRSDGHGLDACFVASLLPLRLGWRARSWAAPPPGLRCDPACLRLDGLGSRMRCRLLRTPTALLPQRLLTRRNPCAPATTGLGPVGWLFRPCRGSGPMPLRAHSASA